MQLKFLTMITCKIGHKYNGCWILYMASRLSFFIRLLLVGLLCVGPNMAYSEVVEKGCNQSVNVASTGQIIVRQECGNNVQTVEIATKQTNLGWLFFAINLLLYGFLYFLLKTVLRYLDCYSTKRKPK